MKNILFIFLGFTFYFAQAQNERTYALDSIYLHKKFFDSISNKNFLQFSYQTKTTSDFIKNHSIFIREYGRGMLASISIRGTSSSHTQIIWNGIPINSILNGQTDLNSINTNSSSIKIIKGGNSAIYGSGAIGGVILLNNNINYNKNFEIKNTSFIGSFNSIANKVSFVNSNNHTFTQINWSIDQSKNDYSFVGFKIKNENGAYQNKHFSIITGYKINVKNNLYFKQNTTNINRLLSRSLYMPSKSKLITKNQRNLLGWQYKSNLFSSQTDIAYLFESYDYFFNKNSKKFSRSIGNIYIAKNSIKWQFTKEKKLTIGNEVNYQEGVGENIPLHHRTVFTTYFLWKNQIYHFKYNIGIRKEFSNQLNIPLTGKLNILYQTLKSHQINLKISRNFRLPTFNDLYWIPGGNPNLKAEKSYNFDISYHYTNKKTNLTFSIFHILSHDLIKWIPKTPQFWQPENFDEIYFSGTEITLNKYFLLKKFFSIKNKLTYTYQQAVNQINKKILPYTPKHVLQNNLFLFYKQWTLTHRYHYQGKIFTTSSNTTYLSAYQIHNLSLSFKINKQWLIQGNINNVFNVYYESFPTHPQPGRNFQFIINYKIS